MGQSLSADVYWGFDLGSDDDYDEDQAPQPQWMEDEEEWDDVLARKLGWNEIPYPSDSAPEGLDNYRLDYQERNRLHEQFRVTPEYQAWSSSLDQKNSLVKSVGVEIDSYGYEYGCRCVRVKASVQTCDYGAKRLTDLAVNLEWVAQVARFCELLEIPIPADGPGWELSASWA